MFSRITKSASAVVVALTALFASLPSPAYAQAGIAGLVRDSSGGALPGVTVEASSPALIERTRTVVTDGAGQYRIVDLSPGTYEVTFALTGFRTVRRTDIVLEGTFVAQVNADLQVGSLQETITVTGATPTVDVVSNTQVQVMNREVLDAIPTPVRNTTGRALLLPGTTVTPFVLGQFNVSVRGSATSDFTIAIDGLRVNNLCGSGQYSGFYMNDASVQEVNYTTAAGSAEVAASGLRVNSVPRDGGNTFAGTFFAYGAGSGLQADNRDDALRQLAAFRNEPPGLAFDWQINPSFGGPIVRDKLWFYVTYKYQDAKNYVASTYENGDQAYRDLMGNYSAVTRVTWQATARDKFRFYVERQANGERFNGFNTYVGVTPEAASDAWGGGWVPQVKWTQTTTNRLLLEAGISYYRQPYWQRRNEIVDPLAVPLVELSTVRISGAPGWFTPTYESLTKDFSSAASASYVTGSHAVKAGMTMLWGENQNTGTMPFSIDRLIFFQGAPFQIGVNNTPRTSRQKVNADFGAYVQDSWTINRFTLNLGGRYDYFNSSVPAQSAPAGPFIVARDFAAIENVPNWHDWAVRAAVSYDLFGNGRTALKFSSGKYLASQAAGYAANFNPMASAVEVRSWLDANGDRTVISPDGSIQFNEIIGGTSNFGGVTDVPDPDLQRGYNWEYNATVEHELFPRIRVSAGYYRRQFYNLAITDNLNLDPNTDWIPFDITVPDDSRLPNAGETITMYTLDPGKRGAATENLRTYSTGRYGPKNFSTYNGFEVSANARIGDRLLAFGGVTADKSQSDNCDQPDNPNSRRFCDAPGRVRTTVKASAVYQLPWDFQVSGFFLARPGASLSANYTVNSTIAGRSVLGSTAGATSISVNLLEPNTLFLPYQNQLDGRVTKSVRLGRARMEVFADIFNVFNANTTTSVNNTFGTAWQVPQGILQGRYFRFGTQWNF